MEADFPKSALEAQDHIRQIRRDKGLGDGPDQIGNNGADLESALKILSNDLYQTSTHFLLELIQNADDNSYMAETPTMSISYSPGNLRIDCNERGFSKQNIEAICRICKSTKSGKSKSAGFVGEKGIGFKAVFKVASTVWISSGYYSFRFDRDGHLGMIAPIIDDFPQQTKQKCTSILLELEKDCDEQRIVEEMKSYDDKILLFLRRLRRLDIDCNPGGKDGRFQRTFTRGTQPAENPSMMSLMNNGVAKHYFVWRHTAKDLPFETRRPGITTSEIVLAFPNTGVNGDEPVLPVIEPQNVYSFLPIRNYGFSFLLQADFLLPANREDVHVDSKWNIHLRDQAFEAFMDAVRHMDGLNNSLGHSWVRYAPTTLSQSEFFEKLRDNISHELEYGRSLESMAGHKKQPGNLIMVSEDWRDDDGRPLVMDTNNEDQFLAAKYHDPENEKYLLRLGVKVMSDNVFIDRLIRLLQKCPRSILEEKSNAWHASLARIICQKSLYSRYDTRMSSLPIIPLRGGEWVSRNRDNVYLPSSSESAIPEGITMIIVDDEAAADPDRRKLYELLKVPVVTNYHIKVAIVNTHGSWNFNPNALSPTVLASHAEFIYNNGGWSTSLRSRLWVATYLGCCRKGESTYRPDDDDPYSASRMLPKEPNQTYGFLHPAYFEAELSENKAWIKFLYSVLGIWVIPRVCDLEIVLEKYPSQKSLTMLRDRWQIYKDCVGIKELAEGISSARVKCTGSMTREQIRYTYAPLDHLTKDFGPVAPFIDIPEPEDPRWKPLLKALGVRVEADLDFYLSCLRYAKKSGNGSFELIRRVMHELEECGNSSNLVNPIGKDKLILVPPKTEGGERIWVSQDECFWRGEPWLTQSVGLERLYPDLETFFRTHLNVRNAGVDHLIKEAAAIHTLPQPALPRIQRLFLALDYHVKAHGLSNDQKKALLSTKMFPITNSAMDDTYEYLSSANANDSWLIADRSYFREPFQSLIYVLVFGAEFISKIKHFTTEAHGNTHLSEDLSESYRSRGKYLFRLMGESVENKQQLRRCFSQVQVFTSDKVVQSWQATLNMQRIDSSFAEGTAFLECDYAGDLRIYLRSGYEKEAHPCELAEQLRNFFNIPIEHRDLIMMVLTDREGRLDRLFQERGISPYQEDSPEPGELDGEEGEYRPVQNPAPSKKSRLGLTNGSRFNRLFSHARFSPSFFKQADNASNSLPTYDVAVARATQNALGRPVEIRTFAGAMTLPSVKGALRDLEFTQKTGAVIGTPTGPPRMLDRVFGLTKRDSEVGEAIVSDILSIVLDSQYNLEKMWTPKGSRGGDRAAFNFTDSTGRFSAFLMRLDGMPGKAKGYTRMTYHLDVKATDSGSFKITQDELDRARKNSVHSEPHPDEAAPSKDVSVLVHISDVRREPKIQFLTDPWDLFEDGQLILENARSYQARLELRPRQNTKEATSSEVGFDAVQFRASAEPVREDPSPEYEDPSPVYQDGKGGHEKKGDA
ncbi:hypothetical protein CDV31_015378 [Fusarium ambrosium]|uniref:Protein NO VEIN C-terminal domain-containing protein n=1 Tax=Fusarium ambrosium TaxID=131363 RepID=A0A428SQ44_9HYPO|nr:hypothetical protein CDV31_015378 [Fusarium ambrosium]